MFSIQKLECRHLTVKRFDNMWSQFCTRSRTFNKLCGTMSTVVKRVDHFAVRTKGHRTKGHQADFSVELFFQTKCTSFRNITQVATLCTIRQIDIFCCCGLLSRFSCIFLYSVKQVIKRCCSIVVGFTLHAKGSDAAW